MSKPIRRLLTLLTVATVLGSLLPSTALGQERSEATVETPSQSEHRNRIVSGKEVAAARQEARYRRDHGAEPTELRKQREDYAETMATLGRSIALERIDAIPVSKDITIVVPDIMEVGAVELIPDEGGIVEVSMETSTREDLNTSPLGMSSSEWLSGPSDCGLLNYSGRGKLLTCYYKNQLGGDGHSGYDVWLYRRRGAYQDYEVSGFNWSATDIIVQSYPTSYSAPKFMGWLDFDPDSDVSGSCSNYTAEISVPRTGLGISFQNCDDHDITWGSAESFKIHYNQGFVFNQGNRSTAFEIAVKIKPGETPYWVDYTSFRTARYTYPGDWCEKYGVGDRNC